MRCALALASEGSATGFPRGMRGEEGRDLLGQRVVPKRLEERLRFAQGQPERLDPFRFLLQNSHLMYGILLAIVSMDDEWRGETPGGAPPGEVLHRYVG